jgi:hypothetical protein
MYRCNVIFIKVKQFKKINCLKVMKLIAHRGNINGPDFDNENRPEAILYALSLGYECEIDIWVKNNELFLGHDIPMYPTTKEFLNNIRNSLWIHAKNNEAVLWLMEQGNQFNWFWHQNDNHTLTSWGFLWSYPGCQLKGYKCVYVMPEYDKTESGKSENLYSYEYICTDYPSTL